MAKPMRILDVTNAQGRRVSWVASQLGVRRSAIYEWDRGQHTPTPEHLKALADLLGVKPKDLR